MVDGALVPEGRAAISPFDRGVLYGEGVFETLRTYRGRIFARDAHLARLARSAARARVTLPCPLATLASETARALAAFDGGEAIVRVIVTGGDGATSTRVILIEPLLMPPPGRYDTGFSVLCRVAPPPGVGGAKTTSYLGNLHARRDAGEAGADEVVFVDEQGNVLEGATSNVFVVSGGVLTTRPVDGRVLDGVTRACVLARAAELAVPVREAPFPVAAMTTADEAFLTSTLREVAPITRVDGVAVRGPGAVTRALHRALVEVAEAGRAPW